MKELTLETLIAVFEEMFGAGLFWAMATAALAVSVLFIWLVFKERTVSGGRLVRAELWAPIGAIAAILFVQWVTNSGFSDIGGPIDVVVLIAIAAAGGIGLTMLVYVALGLAARRKRPAEG
jgi:hypothetical protein